MKRARRAVVAFYLGNRDTLAIAAFVSSGSSIGRIARGQWFGPSWWVGFLIAVATLIGGSFLLARHIEAERRASRRISYERGHIEGRIWQAEKCRKAGHQ